MNTTQLRYLVEYVASGSVQKTAELLNVSRSSITRNIRQLEEELGTRLFINTPTGVAPTHTGEVCLRYAKEILRTEEDLFFDISEQGAYSRVINIGIGTSRSQRVLPAILPEFCQRYPHVSVQLHEMNTADLTVSLLNQRLAFAVISRPADTKNFDFEPVLTERLVLVAPRNDAYVESCCTEIDGKKYVSLKDFRDKPFILGYPGKESRKVSDKLFRQENYSPRIVLQSRNSSTSALTAYNGLAYALVPESCLAVSVSPKIPCYYLQSGGHAEWVVGIATPVKTSLSHAAEQLKLFILHKLGDQATQP